MSMVDLNGDLGESFGSYTIGMDDALLPLLSSANVACGFHASDPVVMDETVARAALLKTAVGAHPGLPDLVGFGRRSMAVSPKEVTAMVCYQVGALQAFCKAHGVPMQHVKPHGALYNMAAADEKLARAVCEGVAAVDERLILLGLSGSCMLEEGKRLGLQVASEVFADRGYRDDGTLVPRSQPGAVITDEEEAIARTVRMVTKGTVITVNGKEIPVRADSVCLHGDNPHAVDFAGRIRAALDREGVTIVDLRKVLEN